MIRNIRLTSGLELVHYRVASTRFVDIALAVGVGSRHEPAKLAGISHFIEHMLFRGCRRMPSSYLLNYEFERIGEGLNAMTHKEFTLFTTKVPQEQAARALELMADVVGCPHFHGLDTERGIVMEEILEELDEDGEESDLEDISRKRIFGSHPIARPVLGRVSTIEKLTADELMEFHRRYYVPSNMVLAVAGSISWGKCRRLATAGFKDVANPPNYTPSVPPALEARIKDGRGGLHFIDEESNQVQVMLTFTISGELHDGELGRLFLTRVLDDGLSSRLQRTVCERRGLLYDISCSIEAMTDVAFFDVEFTVSSKKLVEVFSLVIDELKRLRHELVDDQEFDFVRERFARDVAATAESPKNMASLMAEAFLLKLPMPLDPSEYHARIKSLTPRAVLREARAAFRKERCTLVVRGDVTASQKRKLRLLVQRL